MTSQQPPKNSSRGQFLPYARDAHRAFSSSSRPDRRQCIYFLDANVLLAPYKTRTKALFPALKQVYARLKKDDRLFVSAEVAREFARVRRLELLDLIAALADARTVGLGDKFKRAPILEELSDWSAAATAWEEADKALRRCRRSLEAAILQAETWERHDPVLEAYASLFGPENVRECDAGADEIEAAAKLRYGRRLPPGYKDQGKHDGGHGDLVTWFTMLSVAEERSADVVFVTEEKKEDWFHKSKDDMKRAWVRYELQEEFACKVSGKDFDAMSLDSFLEANGAERELVDQVREEEQSAAKGAASDDSDATEAIMVFRTKMKLQEARLAIAMRDFRRATDALSHVLEWEPLNETAHEMVRQIPQRYGLAFTRGQGSGHAKLGILGPPWPVPGRPKGT